MSFFSLKHRSNSVYRPHHYKIYELNPGYQSGDRLTHHNSYGFRGSEFETSKSKGTFRIVCMGESTTYGYGIKRDQDTYPAQLADALKSHPTGGTAEVLNAGVPGYTSAENLLHFIFCVEPLEPDLIVFYYTHNDVHPRRLANLSRDYAEYSKVWCGCETWREKAARFIGLRGQPVNLGKKVRKYSEAKKKGLVPSTNIFNNPPEHFRSNMRCLALLAKGHGIPILFVNPPYRYLKGDYDLPSLNPVPYAVEQHRRIIEDISQELGFFVLDLKDRMPFPEVDQEHAHPYYLDRVHLSETGIKVMANIVSDYILEKGYISCAAPV